MAHKVHEQAYPMRSHAMEKLTNYRYQNGLHYSTTIFGKLLSNQENQIQQQCKIKMLAQY